MPIITSPIQEIRECRRPVNVQVPAMI
jgi:hypothetical protein